MLRALKRLYLMAHAPAEPQPWFHPDMPPAPMAPIKPKDMSVDERNQFARWREGCIPRDLLTEPRVAMYAAVSEVFKDLSREHMREAARQQLIQWPAAWADAVLSHSNPTRKDKP